MLYVNYKANRLANRTHKTVMVSPQKKSDSLIDEINGMLDRPIDDEAVRRIETEAEKIYKSGQTGDARHVQGMIAALRRDVDGAKKCFETAIKILGKDPLVLENYACALNNLGIPSKASEVIEQATEIHPNLPSTLIQAADIYSDAFQHEKLKGVLDRLVKLEVGVNKVEKFMAKIDVRNSVLRKHKVAESEITGRIELVATALRESGIFYPEVKEYVLEDDILLEFSLFTDVIGAIKAESMICDLIASQQFSPVDRLLNFSFIPCNELNS